MATLSGKKILLVITQSKYGGAQKYILQLAEHFSKKNEVHMAVGEKDDKDPIFFDKAKELGIEPIIIDKLIRDISLVKAFDAAMELRKLYNKLQPDIVHLNSSMTGALGGFAGFLYRFDPLNRLLRVIYTVHGFVFNEPLPPLKKKMYTTIEKITASWKGAIITVSKFDKEQGLKNKIAPDHRMVVIHNGINLTQQFLSKDEARSKLNIASSSLLLCTVASHYKTKGLDYLIDAMHANRDKNSSILCIIGDGPERQSLESQIKERGLEQRVKLLGHLNNPVKLLKAFDLFILPSLKEGFPYAILEAGLAGLPVIATRVGGIPEIITHQESGLLVDSKKPEDLAVAIETMLKDNVLSAKYAETLQKKVRRDFSSDKMLRKTEDLYLKLFPKD